MKEPVAEVIQGKTGFVKSQGWKVWYESIEPQDPINGTILLVMGAANDALSWHVDFISHLTNSGYRVIRYDHRGTGLTTSREGWDRKNPYSLKDMTADPIAILDSLKIRKAHFVGVSMGGMIAQEVAIKYPERTASLTSIMSSANVFDTLLPPISDEIIPEMISAVVKYGVLGGEKGKIKLQVVHKRILMGEATGEINVKSIAEVARYNVEKRTGYHFISGRHHQAAIENSGSRYQGLRKINIPVLVIHGEQDPVIPIAHGKKMVSIISNADSLWLKNMGHDLPDALMSTICAKIIAHIEGCSK